MGAMNATGWVAVVAAGGDVNELWDLLDELGDRLHDLGIGTGGVTIHSLTKRDGLPRFCVHPGSRMEVEVRGDDLAKTLLAAAMLAARELPVDDLWRRD
jgi:hypothetical protein